MKYNIFTIIFLLQSITASAQNVMSIPELEEYLKQHHPEESFGTINNFEYGGFNEQAWEISYDMTKNRPSEKIQLELLKDTILQCFIRASETAVRSYHQQISNGSEDTIRYTLMLDDKNRYTSRSESYIYSRTLYECTYDYCRFVGEKIAWFSYMPGINKCNLHVGFSELSYDDDPFEHEEKERKDPLEFLPLKAMIERIVNVPGTEKHAVVHRYNLKGDEKSIEIMPIQKRGESRHLGQGGVRPRTPEECQSTGQLYLVPKDYSDLIPQKLHQELVPYLEKNLDKEFRYCYSKNVRRKFLQLDCTYTPERIYAQKNNFGQYAILFVENADSTFALPKGYGNMLSFDHGKITYLPGYKQEKEYPLNELEQLSQQLGLNFLGHPNRIEIIGGDSLRQISTWEKNISRDSIYTFRDRLFKGSLTNVQHIEKHTQKGDTIELTASNVWWHLYTEKLICRIMGKGKRYKVSVQHILTDRDREIAMPYDDQWLEDFIQQMKDANCIDEQEVHYEYGKKSDPNSMGKVSGRLYVLKNNDSINPSNLFVKMWSQNAVQHTNQTLNYVEDFKDLCYNININDRILARISSSHDQFQLLCIDQVEGKYLIPEEWYRILDYRYGKKIYLK